MQQLQVDRTKEHLIKPQTGKLLGKDDGLADDVIAPLATGVIADINCEVDAEPRQPPGSSQRQPSTNEDLTLNLQAQEIEKSTQYFCGICQENVQVNKCCKKAAHKECLYTSELDITNCKCFERDRTVNQSDFPAASTSSSKKPSMNDDVSDTWENLPLQTFPHHSEFLSLACVICKREEIFVKAPCCEGHYHPHCLNQYRENGYTTCMYCRRLMQFSTQLNDQSRTLWGGRGNSGGGDDSGSNGGGGGGGGGHDGDGEGNSEGGDAGVRVDDDAVGENNYGGSDSQGGGYGRGWSDNMEGDEGGGVDDGGGGDDDGGGGDDDGGGGSGRDSPLPPPSPPPSPVWLLSPPLHPLPLPPLPPLADNRDDDENSEGGVDDEGRNESSGNFFEYFILRPTKNYRHVTRCIGSFQPVV
ncbi:uncharacterized protein LOC111335577 isoform X4 [Stylophora pistillata]|nr:uncharacterized protein LOC111335577 isoform X4 [Stylophora pistillata]